MIFFDEICVIVILFVDVFVYLDLKNLVYCDIKFVNILFRFKNDFVLIDFGLVWMFDVFLLIEDFIF